MEGRCNCNYNLRIPKLNKQFLSTLSISIMGCQNVVEGHCQIKRYSISELSISCKSWCFWSFWVMDTGISDFLGGLHMYFKSVLLSPSFVEDSSEIKKFKLSFYKVWINENWKWKSAFFKRIKRKILRFSNKSFESVISGSLYTFPVYCVLSLERGGARQVNAQSHLTKLPPYQT